MNGKDKIAQAYKELVIENNKVEISVSEICRHANVSRTLFYKYYFDIYEIIEYIFTEDVFKDLIKYLSENIKSEDITYQWYLSFYKNKDFYKVAFKICDQNSLFEIILNKLHILNKTLSKKIHDNEDDIDYYAYREAALQVMLLKKWMADDMRIHPKKMTEYYTHSSLK